MSSKPSTEKFECRYCGDKLSTVVGTIHSEIRYAGRVKTRIVRHRQCRRCGLRYKTVEFVVEEADHKIKHDAAIRPIYDYGRTVGQLEIINGARPPDQEIPPPEPPEAPLMNRGGRFVNPVEHLSPPQDAAPRRTPPRTNTSKRKSAATRKKPRSPPKKRK